MIQLIGQSAEVSRRSRGYRLGLAIAAILAPSTLITKGITIGEGCVIGANSFVNKDIAAGRKIWSTPATDQGSAIDSID